MTIRQTLSVDEAIEFLNSLIALDAEAITELVETRAACRGNALADHPTVQVHVVSPALSTVGILGILNGLFGVDDKGWGPITATFEANGQISSFSRTKHRE